MPLSYRGSAVHTCSYKEVTTYSRYLLLNGFLGRVKKFFSKNVEFSLWGNMIMQPLIIYWTTCFHFKLFQPTVLGQSCVLSVVNLESELKKIQLRFPTILIYIYFFQLFRYSTVRVKQQKKYSWNNESYVESIFPQSDYLKSEQSKIIHLVKSDLLFFANIMYELKTTYACFPSKHFSTLGGEKISKYLIIGIAFLIVAYLPFNLKSI